jgi:DNA (cytosine-5)-methyltransferase 1
MPPICPTCSKEFKQKGHLTAHLNRKTKCVAPALNRQVAALQTEIQQLRNTIIMPTTVQTAISLFSGAGGDTLGLERAGLKVIAFNEFNEAATRTHVTTFPSSVSLVDPATGASDIKKVPDSVFESYKGRTNLIFAGFPCQGFSHAGKKRSDDKRNELVHEFVRATRIIQPEWIIGENVKGLLSRKGRLTANSPPRPVIEIIQELFESIGYKLDYRVIDTSAIGVPQNRKRLILVGSRGTLYPHVPWDTLEPAGSPSQSSIRPFLEAHLLNAMELPALYKPQDQPTHYWIPTTETVATGTPHRNLSRLVRGLRNRSSKEKEADPEAEDQVIEPAGLISFGVRKGGYHGMVVNPDVPCNTIISTYNLCPRLFVGLYNSATKKYWIRTMTPKELGQIQGFPKDYAWQGTDKEKIIQIGNAVPPPLAERLANTIKANRVVLQGLAPAPAPPTAADVEADEDADEEADEA